MEYVVALVVFSLTIGGVIAHWWAVPIPSVFVAGFYLGLLAGWWGNGVGDAWFVAMFLGFLIATVSACIGIAARRGFDERKRA